MRIRIDFQGPGFVAVPNHVAAMVGKELSPEAVGVLVMLALRPVGSDWAVASILAALGCSRDRWQRISRELRAVGALWDDPDTGSDGRHRGRLLAVRWPVAPAKSARKSVSKARVQRRVVASPKAGKPGLVGPGFPKAGKPGFRSSEVIEIVEQSPVDVVQVLVASKTKTGEAVAPTGAAAASPVDNSASVARCSPEVAQALADWFADRRCASGADADPLQSAMNGAGSS